MKDAGPALTGNKSRSFPASFTHFNMQIDVGLSPYDPPGRSFPPKNKSTVQFSALAERFSGNSLTIVGS